MKERVLALPTRSNSPTKGDKDDSTFSFLELSRFVEISRDGSGFEEGESKWYGEELISISERVIFFYR